MKDPVEVIEYRHHKINVYQDASDWEPREQYDNLGTMICFHNTYKNLGDKHQLTLDQAKVLHRRSDIYQLPLYLMDHSGLAMRTYPFSCPWDSGQVGFIYVEHDKILVEYKRKRITPKLLEKVKAVLEAEVQEYSWYIEGQVYGFEIQTEAGEWVNALWGFYGPYEHYLVPEAKRVINRRTKEQEGLIYE